DVSPPARPLRSGSACARALDARPANLVAVDAPEPPLHWSACARLCLARGVARNCASCAAAVLVVGSPSASTLESLRPAQALPPARCWTDRSIRRRIAARLVTAPEGS